MRLSFKNLHQAINRDIVSIENVHLEVDGDESTIRASVAGKDLWFRARGVKLNDNAHAFAALYLLPTLKTGAILRMDRDINAEAKERFRHVASIAHRWWGFSSKPRMRFQGHVDLPIPAASRTALCFTCGVDSFFSLYQRLDAIDDLLLVHGYDVSLDDAIRFDALSAHAQAVALALGKRLIIVETNLRKHPYFSKLDWDVTHGAALAAVGHLLTPEIGRLFISASFPTAHIRPWGSSAEMDPLWSSKQMGIEHVGDEYWRADKLRKISDEPLVHRHLQVCWKGTGIPLNCGRCEKCVRTQLILLICDRLHLVETFADPTNLVSALDSLSPITQQSVVYESFLKENIPDQIRAAIVRLLVRSGKASVADPSCEHWTEGVLGARIKPDEIRSRYAGGSPNEEEIAAYESALPDTSVTAQGAAIVLGMTPEVRKLAVSRFAQVFTVDRSDAAIKLYCDWLSPKEQEKETIQKADWMHLESMPIDDFSSVKAVFGDGVFGNLPNLETHRSLLRALARMTPKAQMIFRKALSPVRGDGFERGIAGLIEDFRAGRIDSDEFGFCSRICGFLDRHYEAENHLLRNKALFDECAQMHVEGQLTDAEYSAISRYCFDGDNCILTQEAWETLLKEEGWNFERIELSGKNWYRIYPIYRCWKGSSA